VRAVGVAPAFYESEDTPTGYFHQFNVDIPGLSPTPIESYNVIGIVPGTDINRSAEVIVVSAHLDHVGWPDATAIYNGADDNASGVAVVLEVARIVAKERPSRTVLFALFGAEEVGLRGSKAFVDLMAGDATGLRLNINVDMVGILGVGPIGRPMIAALSGGFNCVEFTNVIRDAGADAGVAVTDQDHNEVFERSDQYSFVSAGIPAVFFTSAGAIPKHYHTPDDDIEHIDFAQLTRVAGIVYRTVNGAAENVADCAILRD